MTPRTYATPLAFKAALEQRLRAASSTGTDLARRRQLLVFDRFLARVVEALGDAVMLKGGLVLEIRLERARTTKDIDLRMTGSARNVLERLQAAGRLDLDDFLTFEVQPNAHQADIQNDGMKYDGRRFGAVCKLAGKLYGQAFGVDVAFEMAGPNGSVNNAIGVTRTSTTRGREVTFMPCLPPIAGGSCRSCFRPVPAAARRRRRKAVAQSRSCLRLVAWAHDGLTTITHNAPVCAPGAAAPASAGRAWSKTGS